MPKIIHCKVISKKYRAGEGGRKKSVSLVYQFINFCSYVEFAEKTIFQSKEIIRVLKIMNIIAVFWECIYKPDSWKPL